MKMATRIMTVMMEVVTTAAAMTAVEMMEVGTIADQVGAEAMTKKIAEAQPPQFFMVH